MEIRVTSTTIPAASVTKGASGGEEMKITAATHVTVPSAQVSKGA